MPISIDNNSLRELKEYAVELIKFDDSKKAFEIYGVIEDYLKDSDLGKSNPKVYAELKKVSRRLRWVALNYLTPDQVVDMFNSHLQPIFSMEYFDVREKLKSVLIAIPKHEARDELKARVKKALEQNQALLTLKKFANGSSQTVENWIKLLTSVLGTGIADPVKLGQFFITNKDYKSLNDIEKKRVKNFLEFYEKLKLSSITVSGIEEEVRVNTPEFTGYIKDGALVKDTKLSSGQEKVFKVAQAVVSPVTAPQAPTRVLPKVDQPKQPSMAAPAQKNTEDLKAMAQKYPVGSLERKAIEEEMKRQSYKK